MLTSHWQFEFLSMSLPSSSRENFQTTFLEIKLMVCCFGKTNSIMRAATNWVEPNVHTYDGRIPIRKSKVVQLGKCTNCNWGAKCKNGKNRRTRIPSYQFPHRVHSDHLITRGRTQLRRDLLIFVATCLQYVQDPEKGGERHLA